MPVHNTYLAPMSIYLDSALGNHETDLGNRVSFPLRTPVVVPQNMDCYVQLSAFRYVNIFYNIDAHNCVFYYSLSSDISEIYSVEVPVGNYNVTSLLTYLNSQLDDSFFLIEYEPSTFRIVVTNSFWGFIIRDGPNSIARSLGIVAPTPQATSHIARYSVSIGGVSVVNVLIPNLLLNSNGVSGSYVSCLDSILNDVLVGTTKSLTNDSAVKYRVNQTIINQIDVVLTGEGNRDLDMQGHAFFLNLELSFVYKFDVQLPKTLVDMVGGPSPEPEPDPAEPKPDGESKADKP